MNIIIDIGHANNTGARGALRDGSPQEEHALCSVIAKHLQAGLQEAGHVATVLDFPEKSNAEDLRLTIAAANAISGAQLGISLHCDSFDSATARGAHVCYFSETGQRIARCIAAPLCALLPGRAESIVRRTDLAVLKQTRAPWVLCECGFITNADDCALQKNQPDAISRAILRGVEQYAATVA